jgi:hypothetical protein
MVTSIRSSEEMEQPSLHKKISPSEQTIVKSRDHTIPSQEARSISQMLMSKKPLSGAITKKEEITKKFNQKPQTPSTSEAKTES